jgi:pimeloyl-ACP methyl ester carboxylesterase
VLPATVWHSEVMTPSPVITVPQHELDDLTDRLRRTRWAPAWPLAESGLSAWDAGTDQETLRRLVAYWADGFDWRAAESEINALPWRTADLDGTPLRYLRFDAEQPGALPIVLTNGWPSSALVQLARRLSEPSRFGGVPADAFTVIVPALPGLPFSPQRPTLPNQTHELWHRLMSEELGFARYAAHGGDLGSAITARLAQAHPESVVGIHVMSVSGPQNVDLASLTDAESAYLDAEEEWAHSEGGYQHQQKTRPLTLAPGLSDSPAGLLSWIVEKHRAWSDCDGDLATRFSDDYLLTVASAYWFTNSISTSFRPYFESDAGLTPTIAHVTVPTAVAVFPHDLAQPPRTWAERVYNVTRFTEMPHGGHFAPHEETELLATDLTEFFRALR